MSERLELELGDKRTVRTGVPAKIHRVDRPRDVGYDRGALPAEEIDDPPLDRPGGETGGARERVGDRSAATVFDLGHPLVYLRQASVAPAHANGKRQENEAELGRSGRRAFDDAPAKRG